MALTITPLSNQTLSGYRIMKWTLSGTPEVGQQVQWGVYSYSISFLVSPSVFTVDQIGAKIAQMTNDTTASQWKSASSAYSSFQQDNPLGFKPTGTYTANNNIITLTLNTQNQFYLGTTSAPAVPVPTPVAPSPVPVTQSPVPLLVTPATAPTVPQAPVGFKYVEITAQSVGADAGNSFNIYHTSTLTEDNRVETAISRSMLLTGMLILVPDSATTILIVNATGDCTGNESTSTITVVPTPTAPPTRPPSIVTPVIQTPTPLSVVPFSPSPTTPVPFSQTYYRIQGCSDGFDYTASKFNVCVGGNLQGNINQYSVGDVVQFATGTSCPTGATYCGTIMSTNFIASQADAILTREATVASCQDFLHCNN